MISFEPGHSQRLRRAALHQIHQVHPLHKFAQDVRQHLFVRFIWHDTRTQDPPMVVTGTSCGDLLANKPLELRFPGKGG